VVAVLDAQDVRTVATGSGEVRVRDTGGSGAGAPPVLLVHSLLADPDLYAEVVPLLVARGHRCVVPELPLGAHRLPLREGADLTPLGLATLLAEVLDALEVPVAHVVGVDTGGALAQLLMAGHRDRVGRVVLTACDAYDAFPPRSLRPLLALLRSPLLLRAMQPGARLRWVRRAFVPGR